MNIFGKRTVLRAIEPEDLEMLREMINEPNIEGEVDGWSFPVSKSEQLKWYESSLKDQKILRFIINTLDATDTTSIGMIYLSQIDWKNRSIMTGIKLTSNAPKRKGYATDAVMALFSYSFDELQLNRINLKILCDNQASVGLYEKCGAKREGILRNTIFKHGKYHDQFYYGVLKADFEEARKLLGW